MTKTQNDSEFNDDFMKLIKLRNEQKENGTYEGEEKLRKYADSLNEDTPSSE